MQSLRHMAVLRLQEMNTQFPPDVDNKKILELFLAGVPAVGDVFGKAWLPALPTLTTAQLLTFAVPTSLHLLLFIKQYCRLVKRCGQNTLKLFTHS
jgi:hypothetical protein